MRFTYGVVCLITVAAGLAPMATPAAVSASSVRSTAHGTKGCIKVTATIHVGHAPTGVAVNPKTNTVYVANSGVNE